MVTVDTFISINPIGKTKSVKKECDWCGCRCYGTAREEKLYDYKGEELCFGCLWDAMNNDEVFSEVE